MHGSEAVPITAATGLRPSLPALLLTVLTVATPVSAIGMTVADIEIPETLRAGEHTLVLNGAGMRTKMFIKAYVACLYVSSPDDESERILAADEPQAVVLHINSELVTRERLTASLPKDLRRSTGNDLDSIRPQTEQLLAMIDGEVADGDVFRMIYLPGEGIQVWHNERFKGSVEGLEFKRALFGIWLSENPAQKSLKRALLRAGSAE